METVQCGISLCSIPRNDYLLLIAKKFTDSSSIHMPKRSPKYPSSPSCKRCEQDVVYSSGIHSAEEKSLSSPPGKYGRKTET